MTAEKLFFIYVAKNDEWGRMQEEDWGYVSAMVRFYHWWIKRFFDFEITVEADILPVIPGKLFDRMSLALLLRDHESRGKDIYHFYLAYFKPFFTDCRTEGYTTNNFGMALWERPKEPTSETARYALFAKENCPRISHVIAHEVMRQTGIKKKQYFDKVHDLWDEHVYKDRPFLYFDSQFKRVNSDGSWKFSTIDATEFR